MDAGKMSYMGNSLVGRKHVAPEEMTGHCRKESTVGAEFGDVCKRHTMQGLCTRVSTWDFILRD